MFALVEQYRVDVSFKVVDGDERQALREGECFGIGDPDEKSSCQARAGSNGNGVEIGESDAGLGQRCANYRDDGAKMFAAGKLGNHTAVARVGGNLRSDDRGESVRAALDDRGGRFVAGCLNAEDEAARAQGALSIRREIHWLRLMPS